MHQKVLKINIRPSYNSENTVPLFQKGTVSYGPYTSRKLTVICRDPALIKRSSKINNDLADVLDTDTSHFASGTFN